MGIWKIEEPEIFFSQAVPLQRNISHPHKRLQHLAGRYLLQFLFPDFPYELILIADTRKPFLSNEAYHFSISHCGDYAAAIVSRTNRVGVDIEIVKPIIHKIKHKFLSREELQLINENSIPQDNVLPELVPSKTGDPGLEILTICWSAKEAMYKWFGSGGVDFKQHMQLTTPIAPDTNNLFQSRYIFSKEKQEHLTVVSKVFGKLVMSYVIS